MSARESVTCPACGEPAGTEDRFCEVCGTSLTSTPPDDGRIAIDRGPAAAATHRGLRHRRNEDAMFLEVLADSTVVVVCDGVSTSSHPQLASRAAADAAGSVLCGTGDGDGAALLTHAIEAAQSAVERVPWSGRSHPGPPACTIVAAKWDGHHVTVANVGDSRAYWIGEHDARCLTEDDSMARELELRGYTAQQVADSGELHAIVRWLGRDAPVAPYRVATFTPEGPGRLVLCSDGLWNYASEAAAFAELVHRQGERAADLAHALVDHALASGGDDNVTVAVVDVVLSPPAAAIPALVTTPEEHS